MSLLRPSLRAGLLLGGLALAFAHGVARADVPSDEPETCTVDNMVARGGVKCQECTGAYHGDREACTRQMAETTMVFGCKTQGASVWTEVWCEQKPSDAAVPETKSRFGCSVDAAPPTNETVVASLALLGLLGLRRRVSRRA